MDGWMQEHNSIKNGDIVKVGNHTYQIDAFKVRENGRVIVSSRRMVKKTGKFSSNCNLWFWADEIELK